MKIHSKKGLFLMGVLAGLVAVALAVFGNPKNMAICIACFIRDIAGSMKFHSAGVVQYFRPEIAGIIFGSFLISLYRKEFKATAGSSTVLRFFLGVIMMIGALVFLGCPTRMVLRMSAGDLSAWIGLIGFVAGVSTGVLFLKKGFSLGRNYENKAVAGAAFPVALMILTILSGITTWFVASKAGPGSIHAPFMIALTGGLLFGVIAQLSRMCFAGSIRDILLMRSVDLALIIGGIFVVMLVYNIATKQFALTATGPVGHTAKLWNILGMYVVGFAAVLLGGCPLRQLVLVGQGSGDSAVTFLGMFVGAAAAHNFNLAAAPANLAKGLSGGPAVSGQIAIVVCLVALFGIAWMNLRRKVK
ncbi:hypothetical protein ABB02_01140 [Clostridiaceae bacterium JG1575]|nr:hypothetical protein ABB02_01140 [Clostridiaceae bacterium JG1575]